MGTDTALETADIALMADELSKLAYLMELSGKGGMVIRENIWSSILIKSFLGIRVFPGWVSLVLAVLVGDMGQLPWYQQCPSFNKNQEGILMWEIHRCQRYGNPRMACQSG